eukprot:1257259-Pleurochrysis_carterae.AAC.1
MEVCCSVSIYVNVHHASNSSVLVVSPFDSARYYWVEEMEGPKRHNSFLTPTSTHSQIINNAYCLW